jgi:hypothetical protein
MTKTRNNHYVPQWYQKGFFEPNRNTYWYLDLAPTQHTLPNGRIETERSLFNSPTSRAFSQRDLYSTFFGTSVSDGIERKLFGNVDTRGAKAIRAFFGEDRREWHDHFQAFFEFLDIQKIRTPKGLDWLRAQYPQLSQNELMSEMQGIRLIHCTIWTEGVREIVSAQDAEVKFIASDHPVTVYNHATPPDSPGNRHPNDPSIALKGSQTIFPLNRDFCLILTNLEYAENPATPPLEKRAFSGNYRSSFVRTDAIIRSRKLTSAEVVRINRVIKMRAKRYIAAGKEEWLYPENSSTEPWRDLRSTLLPPDADLWRFGGELYARSERGEVYYQDAFGRTEKERDFLKKKPPQTPPRDRAPCGCGSGRAFGPCCKHKPIELRPTSSELSIRERNIILFTGISKILGLVGGRDWVTIRREITDEKIKKVYELYDALWPLQTNLLSMLPKPDGVARAIYTGILHPTAISNCAPGLSLYFDEVLIEHPIIHPRTVAKKYSPLEYPMTYRQEFLNSVVLLIEIMPFVEKGLVNLFPSPCNFDFHLRDQTMEMAKIRSQGLKSDPAEEAGLLDLMKADHNRAMLLMPREALYRQIQRKHPKFDHAKIEDEIRRFDLLREIDPLSVLQEGSLEGGKDGGQFIPFKLAPNFEITMYLSQVTGSCIVTDSITRWRELMTSARHGDTDKPPLAELRASIEDVEFIFPRDARAIVELADQDIFGGYPALMKGIFKYLANFPIKGTKPNVEANLNSKFKRVHGSALARAMKVGVLLSKARVSCLWPSDGIQNNSVNRLLLMSSSEFHLRNAPMALFVERDIP